MTRRGFTLVELMLSMILAAIVGAALVRMTLAQARFMDQQEAWRSARGVSRGGINRLVSDLRAVEATGGLTAAVAGGQDFTVRVPYAFGIVCSAALATATVSLLPVDSAMYSATGHTGFAVRNATTGAYAYYTSLTGSAPPVAGLATACTTVVAPDQPILAPMPSINGSPAGKVVTLVATGNLVGPPPKGSIVFLYRTIRYQFKNSTALPGRTGLFRTRVTGATEEELVAPFSAAARVNFYVLNATTAQAAVPADLTTVRGLELVLTGQSEGTPGGSAAPKSANVTTSIFFENRSD